ncbi:MAG: phosphoadenylyl-sulfate reductase [Sphingomonadales bacterium]
MTTAAVCTMEDAKPGLEDLAARYGHLDAADLLRVMITDIFPGKIALVSSFGAESSVLLHLTAAVDPAIPVIFLDTRKLFGETLRYRDALIGELNLSGVRSVLPDTEEVERDDHSGLLWTRDIDACCALRKVRPLDRALEGFDAWITGRKRFQSEERAGLETIEITDGRVKINPVANWNADDIEAYMVRHDLPRHPLVADGYLSIGCMPCTRRIRAGESYRDGRWAGLDKTECGIHIGEGI